MNYVLTAKEMKTLDQQTIEKFGVPSMVLMERAALAVCERVLSYEPNRILVLCGSGNNGGDGFALSRLLLQKGVFVATLFTGDKSHMSVECEKQKETLAAILQTGKYRGEICSEYQDETYDVIVDCMFGIGLSRNIEGEFAKLLERVNAAKAVRIAVDIPSGVEADTGHILGTCFLADETVTIAYPKRGLYLMPGKAKCGKITVCDIGIVPAYDFSNTSFCYDDSILEKLKKRDVYGHKGSYGKLGIIAGSKQIAGAAILSVCSAYHSGCGYVRLLTHENNYVPVLAQVPEAVLSVYTDQISQDELEQQVKAFLAQNSTILIGPGLSTCETARVLVQCVLQFSDKPLVIDADACNLIAQDEALQQLLKQAAKRLNGAIIMTPHLTECARLCKVSTKELQSDVCAIAKQYVKAYGVVLCVKDAGSIVCSPKGELYINVSGCDSLATAGSGDVLAGIAGAYLAEFENPFESMTLAMYVHGFLGDRAKQTISARYTTASDLLAFMKELQ